MASTSYTYDALGRVAARKVSGASTETFAYDNLGRLSSHGGDLGSFTYSYLGETPQLVGRSLAGSTLTTSWSYLDNLGDRRLAGIANTGLSAQQFTNFQYTSIPGLITSITQTSDAAISSSVASQQTASFNNLNQLTNLSGQAYSWDLNGNLLSDGSRNYTWDAENRLVGISYTSAPGKATTFTYDGLGRRVTTGNKPSAGGTNTVVSYHWCGDELCQARDASGTVTRGYYAEGELVSGQPVYYGVDQIGSVRRAFVSASNAPAYDFDEYGKALQSTPPLTDFGFAGLVNQVESGMSLAQYRAYDPVVGRWISRDPIQEAGGINLYSYVNGAPLMYTDPMGLQAIPVPPLPIPGVPNPSADAQRSLADALNRSFRNDSDTTYQTYTRYNPLTGDCYSGRTSGNDTPENNVRNRGYGQRLLNDEGFLPPVLDRSSSSYSAIRGREQQLIDLNGGARSSGGTSRNMINGISPLNPRGPFQYIPAAIAEFGTPVPAGKCTCQ